ncbi:restriction endonuclease subunit S [Ruminococcus albus]|uniref:restriction endonuclease subunit S n=1 Tax=Ruminococcus albus TaxID=1264 RepID=UPI001FA6CEE3|nr:restriction endonuclease subunit S [Ruminococcus albus]
MALCLLASSFVNELPMANSYYDSLHYEKMPDGTVKCIEDEIPYDLPEGWEWARLQSICEPITDGTHKTPTYSDEGFIFLSSKNVTSGHIDWDNIMYIPESLHNELYARLAPQKNDILLAKNGTTGVAAIVNRDCVFDIYVSLALLRIIGYIISPEYLLSTIASSTIQNYFNSSLKGIGVPNLHLEHIRTTLIPVAPINEQNRIAAKLEQLLSFADNIESDKTDLQTTIQLTKSKILDLAIRGKLVPQNPDDEPASVLLDRIRAEKEELIKQGKIKRDKKESVIFKGDDNSYYETIGSETTNIDDKIPFDLPDGWSFERLCNIASFSGGKTPSTSKDEYWGNDYFWITSKDMKSKYIDSSQISLSEKGAEIMQIIAPDTLLLVARSGILRHTLPVAILKRQATINQDIKAISIYNTSLVEFIYTFLKGMENSILLRYTKSGTTVENINFDEFKSIVIPIPPLNEQKRIADKVSQLFSLLDSIAENVN